MELDSLGRLELQDFGQVPGDSFAFPVRVGGQDHAPAVLLGRRCQLVDRLAPAFDNLVVRLETVLNLDPHLLSRQVADVAHRGQDVETVTQEPLQSPGLGRRLDDDQTFRHSHSYIPQPPVLVPYPPSRQAGRRLRRASYPRSFAP